MAFILRKCVKIVKSGLPIRNVRDLTSRKTILGIETSCDDTGCAVVNSNGVILGESLYSQNLIHVRYGGVNPLVAYELHRNNIELAVKEALDKSSIKIENVDAIAVTTQPGMLINLKVGVKYAKYLAKLSGKPLIPIHHMEAHALAARMYEEIPFPFLVLLISGGHCLLALVRDVDDYLLLGKSLDNPPGEIMDKVARRMKLKNIAEYSKVAGGRAIELAALKAKDMNSFEFPLPIVKSRDCNFSFSGLKDSVIRKLLKKESEHGVMGDEIIPEVHELCASFQCAIAEHLAHRTERAVVFCEQKKLITEPNRNIVVSGGVACNNFIFKAIEVIGTKMGYNVFRPPPKLCTDNGIMIAWNGIEKLKKKSILVTNIDDKDIHPVAPLGKSYIDEVVKSNIPVKVTRINKYLKL
ncbi:tRNA N6-adenosine threonylcarbamoyltransferase, mitochondrial-like [Ostrinia nubilalis]|uniref:tRNA N6-adenosine threonylcarbamoyltransferase, mitochondrial-like n=1 Tax=Ostrinia nubilalis TaxID=29057 RepID=UPI00103AD499|nr:probable tRNA N6-adenosine threonylcarbamoyltransferase, mitochondrial [Ostrinia furnacalis]